MSILPTLLLLFFLTFTIEFCQGHILSSLHFVGFRQCFLWRMCCSCLYSISLFLFSILPASSVFFLSFLIIIFLSSLLLLSLSLFYSRCMSLSIFLPILAAPLLLFYVLFCHLLFLSPFVGVSHCYSPFCIYDHKFIFHCFRAVSSLPLSSVRASMNLCVALVCCFFFFYLFNISFMSSIALIFLVFSFVLIVVPVISAHYSFLRFMFPCVYVFSSFLSYCFASLTIYNPSFMPQLFPY